MALINLLIMPLNAFPWTLSGLVEAWVSLGRLGQFFALNEIDNNDYYWIFLGTSLDFRNFYRILCTGKVEKAGGRK